MTAKKPPAHTQTPPAARTTPPKPTTLFTLFVPEDHDDDAAGPHLFEDFAHYESAPHTLIALQEMSDAAEEADVGPLLVVYDKDLDTGRRMATVFLHDDYIELLMETIAEDAADDEDAGQDVDAGADDGDDGDTDDLASALPVPLSQTRASIGPGVPSARAKAKGAPKTQAGETPAETTAPGKSTAKATATAPSLNPATKPAKPSKPAKATPAGRTAPRKK